MAEDKIAQHYTARTLPLSGICLDPALELDEVAGDIF